MKIENLIRSNYQFNEVAFSAPKSAFAEKFMLLKTPLENQSGAGSAGILQAIEDNNPIHTHLKEVASQTDFSDPQQTQGALLEAAHSMIQAHLGDRFPQQKLAESLINDMSQTIASDPILKQKLTSLLLQLKDGS